MACVTWIIVKNLAHSNTEHRIREVLESKMEGNNLRLHVELDICRVMVSGQESFVVSFEFGNLGGGPTELKSDAV